MSNLSYEDKMIGVSLTEYNISKIWHSKIILSILLQNDKKNSRMNLGRNKYGKKRV